MKNSTKNFGMQSLYPSSKNARISCNRLYCYNRQTKALYKRLSPAGELYITTPSSCSFFTMTSKPFFSYTEMRADCIFFSKVTGLKMRREFTTANQKDYEQETNEFQGYPYSLGKTSSSLDFLKDFKSYLYVTTTTKSISRL